MTTDVQTRPAGKKNRRPRIGSRGRHIESAATADVSTVIGRPPYRRDLLIEYLHKLQDHFGALFAPHIVALADLLNLAPVEVYEVATFYHHFDFIDPARGDLPPAAVTIRVCDSITCELCGAESLYTALTSAHSGADVRIQRVPCIGRCDAAPLAVVGQNPIGYATLDRVATAIHDRDFTAALPTVISFEEYVAKGGYNLLHQVRSGEVTGEQVITALEAGGLRGLGGAGFTSGRKWRIVGAQAGPRYLCINIDEGEPGTFKDRSILETDPHRMIEGALIAAHVVGCERIVMYLRDEYAGIRAVLTAELKRLSDGFQTSDNFSNPSIEIRRGAGAYICGEESAMIESIEGKRGIPRLRPPYVAEVGLFGRPTLVHNCETLWWVRDMVQRGPEWFESQGRNGRKGLRRYSVSGRVRNPGVKLAPAGITVRELIEEFCESMQPGHDLYAYFPGGASGGLLPASLADIPLDFDTLQPHGSFIGSAAVIVLGHHDSARAAALNAMRFFKHESCGQCTPCRLGTAKAVTLMEHPTWDAALMSDLSQVMIDASICGLGQAAPNPMMSVLKHFSHELLSK